MLTKKQKIVVDIVYLIDKIELWLCKKFEVRMPEHLSEKQIQHRIVFAEAGHSTYGMSREIQKPVMSELIRRLSKLSRDEIRADRVDSIRDEILKERGLNEQME